MEDLKDALERVKESLTKGDRLPGQDLYDAINRFVDEARMMFPNKEEATVPVLVDMLERILREA